MQQVLGLLLRLIQLEARAVIRAPEFSEKLRLARVLTRDIVHADGLADRISYLGDTPDLTTARVTPRPNEGCVSDRACFREYCTNILSIARQALPTLHPTWDQPTRDIVAGIISAQEAKLAADDAAPDWGPAPGTERFEPGRSIALQDSSPPPGWAEKPQHQRMAVEMIHFLLVQTEIPTIELCCSIILEFPNYPWKLTVDLAQQIADEIRHAQSCLDRIDELGGRVGQFAADLRIWRLTAPLDAELRLAVHQRIGEWIGVDGLLWWADVFAGQGDERTSAMLRFMCADEVNHVALGVRWLRQLAGSEEAVWQLHHRAEALRLAAGEGISSKGRYPFNEWACRQAGLSEAEIAHYRGLAQPELSAQAGS